jgi:hypothetical protein
MSANRDVNSIAQEHAIDFTYDNYRQLLRQAKQKYVFRGYTTFSREERFVLWRHDIDLSMHSARNLARIEFEEGVAATYFVNLHSEWYNALEQEISNRLHDILRCGHEIGLHFDSHYYRIDREADLADALTREKNVLEMMLGCDVKSFSFHNTTPFTMSCREYRYAGLVNVYADYFQSEVGYCSDSNGYWRYRRLADVLSEGRDERLQVLTHDAWWQDAPMSVWQRLDRCIEGRAERMRAMCMAHLDSIGIACGRGQ